MPSPVAFITGFAFRHPGAGACQPHRHRAVEIVFHQEGRGVLHLQHAPALPFAPGQTTICPADRVHHQAMAEAGCDWCLLIIPPPELAETLAQPLLVGTDISAILRGELEHLALGADTAADHQERDLRAATVVGGLLARARRGAPPCREASLAEAAAYILATRLSELLALDEVARSLDVGPDHLRHVFRAHHGMPMLRFLNRLRLARAKELLTHTTLTLRDIARACGYRSEQYLCAVFQRLEGRPPGAFRVHRSARRR